MSELDLTIREEDLSANEDQLDDSGEESREPAVTTSYGHPDASDEGMHEAADKPSVRPPDNFERNMEGFQNPTLELFESLEREIQAEQEECHQKVRLPQFVVKIFHCLF